VGIVTLPQLQFDSAQQKISLIDELKLTNPVEGSLIEEPVISEKDGKSGG
jgi:hypothetical protein